jgi:hypothetical protein
MNAQSDGTSNREVCLLHHEIWMNMQCVASGHCPRPPEEGGGLRRRLASLAIADV